MNKSYLLAATLAVMAALALFYTSTPAHQEDPFQEFKTQFQKTYSRTGEEHYRKMIFLNNLARIESHNSDSTNTYKMGVNQFTDLSDAEFRAIYLTLQVPTNSLNIEQNQDATVKGADIDWREKGGVTPIKNQGACGSCWAFSAVGGLESAKLVKERNTFNFSEQDLVDCSKSYGNNGCNGGWTDNAYKYIRDKGIATTIDYPYMARDQTCNNSVARAQKISSFVDVPGCTAMLSALQNQPISVGVDASNWSPYKSGVFSNCQSSINHGVVLVGATDTYWIVKNSWGTGWGESGYIRLAIGNTCAVCNYPSYPVL